VAQGDPVFEGRTRVGAITSATRSPLLRTQIALARVDVGSAALGRSLEIGKLDGRQKRLPAVVVPFPHYDPQKTRVRS
jgi:aminomethyltransferase